MKINDRSLKLVCLMGFGVMGLGAGAPGLAHAACTGGGTLTGGYGMLVTGDSLTTTKGGKYLSGALKFDGKCGFSGSHISGGVNGVAGTVSVTGSYNTNPDGTISLKMIPSDRSVVQTYIVGYSATEKKAVGIEMDHSAAATIDLQAQFNSPPAGYTTGSLRGRFAGSCNGLSSSLDDGNYFTFDGAGGLTGVNPFDRNGSVGSAQVTGVYTVNSDGTFQGKLTNNSFTNFSFTGVISNSLNEIQYTYVQTNLGGIVACKGWH